MVILLQGAVKEEINVYLEKIDVKEVIINNYCFYETNYNNHTLIISLTNMGIMNATIATMIGINTYHPDLIINQGSCGGHVDEINDGDIIICDKAVYINNYITPKKKLNEGSNSLSWVPFEDLNYVIDGTKRYLDLADNIKGYNLVHGIIGSGDLFTREIDRINYIHSLFNELAEEMETVASYKVASTFNIDHIAIRIVSNNELHDSDYFTNYPIINLKLQEYVLEYLKLL